VTDFSVSLKRYRILYLKFSQDTKIFIVYNCDCPNLLQPRGHYFPFSDLGTVTDLLGRGIYSLDTTFFHIPTSVNYFCHLVSTSIFSSL
jgi:hypothetical protein